jgi:signal transduction histidine kinase
VPGKIECRFVCHAPVLLDNLQTAGHLYRIAQEAVNNALKHARTERILIALAHEQGALRLQIKDYGRGLPKSRKSKPGLGLEVMQHRAHVIGASLEIDSKPGEGVSVTCTLPFENHEH